MKSKNRMSHIISIVSLVVFIVLSLASGTKEPARKSEDSSGRQTTQNRQSGGQIAPAQSGGQTTQQSSRQAAQAQTTSPYFTGNGGRGMRLGILMPHSQGLDENQSYLPAMIQGVLVSNMSRYSAISVLDRVSLDRVIMETLDLTYEDDLDIVSLGHVAQVGHMMTGNIIKTSTGFSLQLNVTDTTAQANTVASYSGTCTAAELDDHSAIHRASLELLSQMNVALTARSRNELGRASAPEAVSAQAALARGVTAQWQGTEVAALSYYLQASEIDPSLSEAETRLENLTASITSGNIGADARNDIQWRNQWLTRLRETELFMAQYLKENPLYYLIYSPNVEQGVIDYARETVTLSIELRSLPEPSLFQNMNRLTSTIRSGLQATGRTEAWQINWPAQSRTTPSPFFADPASYNVVVEILNAGGTSIARQTANLRTGGWFVPERGAQLGLIAPHIPAGVKVEFPGVDVNAITDSLSIRISSINGIAAERAVSQLGIRVLPQREYNNIQSVVENGLHTDNLRQFTIRYSRNDNVIDGYSGSGASVAIPYGVTFVNQNSGLREKGLGGITIPATVTTIGNYAFYNNVLTSVTIPDSVTSIGEFAFAKNHLTSAIILDSVTDIGAYAFNDNDTLRSVTIGANVRFGGNFGAFKGNFSYVYTNNNSRAGIYTSDGSTRLSGPNWTYSPSR